MMAQNADTFLGFSFALSPGALHFSTKTIGICLVVAWYVHIMICIQAQQGAGHSKEVEKVVRMQIIKVTC